MTLIAFGINHKTAPVEMREKVAFSPDSMVDALSALRDITGAEESVILSTCNRTEVYVSAETLEAESLSNWLADFHGLDRSALLNNSYIHHDQSAVNHIMRVASGLDSLILGEPQILGQVKQAFTSAKHSGAISASFERLFQQTFSVAKKVRSDTDIGANAVSVAYAAVQLAKHIFSSLQNSRVLLIGAGETIDLVARHLKEQQPKGLMVANRTLEKARQVAEPLGAEAITLAQIPHHLKDADIVISSTASQLPILGKGMVERALKERRHKPMFLVDLAVPRDIESEVSELSDAYLYTVDDLQHIVEKNLASRQTAAQEAEVLIEAQVQTYMHWTQAQDSIDLLRDFRQQSLLQRDKLQAKALNQLAEGKDPQDVLAEFANKLTNSLIHGPTRALKLAAESQDQSALNILRQTLSNESDN